MSALKLSCVTGLSLIISLAISPVAIADEPNPRSDAERQTADEQWDNAVSGYLAFIVRQEEKIALARTDGAVGYDFNSQSDLAIRKSPTDLRLTSYQVGYRQRLAFDDGGLYDDEDDTFQETFLEASARWWGDDDDTEATEPERQGVSAGWAFLYDDTGYGTGVGFNEGVVHTQQKLDLEGWRADVGVSSNLNLEKVWNPFGADRETIGLTAYYQRDEFGIDQTTTITPFGGYSGDAIGWEGIAVDRDRLGLSLRKDAFYDCDSVFGLVINPFILLDLGRETTDARIDQQITSPAALNIPQFNQQLDVDDDKFFIEPTIGLSVDYFVSPKVSLGFSADFSWVETEVLERESDGNARYYNFNSERNGVASFGLNARWHFY